MCKSEMWGILTEREAKRLMTRATNGNASAVTCKFCGELIQIGDTFIRKRRSGRRVRTRATFVDYYHERCWKSLLH